MRVTRPTALIFLLVAAFLAVVGRSKMLGDPDTYWHIVVGHRILQTRQVVTTVVLLALCRVRHGPLVAVTAMLALTQLLPESRVGQWLPKRGFWHASASPAPGSRAWGAALTLVSAGSLILALIGNTSESSPEEPARWVRPPAKIWAYEIDRELGDWLGQRSQPARILSDQLSGGYLLSAVSIGPARGKPSPGP